MNLENSFFEDEGKDEDLNNNYIYEYLKKEKNYEKFYNTAVNKININFLYLDEKKEIYDFKILEENIFDSCLKSEKIIYLVKNFQKINNISHHLIDIIVFNIDINYQNLNKFCNSTNLYSNNFLDTFSCIKDIYFKDTIHLFQDLTSVYFILKKKKQIDNSNSLVKNITIKNSKNNKNSKTRRV